jgi:serine/threonine-protein kinase
LAADPDTRRRFESEARLAARLVHPNVVAVFDSGESDGIPFLVMERLPGRTLADAIAQGPVDPDEARAIGAQVLDALAAAHAAGMVHRDVKPGNVLATGSGVWKVADFGIAKSLEVADGDATVTGIVMGTPAYLAPERVAGGQATVATDIYAAGVLLYEALCGRRPVEAGAPPAALLAPDPTPISELCPQVPPDLAATVSRAMAINPHDRFPDAASMALALRRRPPAAATVAMPALEDGAATTIAPAPDEVPGPGPGPTHPGTGTRRTADPHQAITQGVPSAPAAPPGGRDPAVPDAGRRRLYIAGGAGAAFVVVVALAIGSLGHHHSSPRTPATASTTTAVPSGALPPSLNSALERLQGAVRP